MLFEAGHSSHTSPWLDVEFEELPPATQSTLSTPVTDSEGQSTHSAPVTDSKEQSTREMTIEALLKSLSKPSQTE